MDIDTAISAISDWKSLANLKRQIDSGVKVSALCIIELDDAIDCVVSNKDAELDALRAECANEKFDTITLVLNLGRINAAIGYDDDRAKELLNAVIHDVIRFNKTKLAPQSARG